MKKSYPYLNKDGSKDRRYYPNHVRKKKRKKGCGKEGVDDFGNIIECGKGILCDECSKEKK